MKYKHKQQHNNGIPLLFFILNKRGIFFIQGEYKMVQFKPVRCAESSLPEQVSDGSLYVTTDTKKIYIDTETSRLLVQEVISVANEAALPLAPLSGKLYVALEEASLWIYSNGWIEIGSGSGGSGYVLPTASTETLGGVKIDGVTIQIDDNGVISGVDAYTKTETDALLNDKQHILTAGENITITNGILGQLTPDWHTDDGKLDPVPELISMPGMGVATDYYPFNQQTMVDGDSLTIQWDMIETTTYTSATTVSIQINGTNGTFELVYEGYYPNRIQPTIRITSTLSSVAVINSGTQTLNGANQNIDCRYKFVYEKASRQFTFTKTLLSTNEVVSTITGSSSADTVIPLNGVVRVRLNNLNGSTGGINIYTDSIIVSAGTQEITTISSATVQPEIATTTQVGVVRPDGSTITVSEEGVISAVQQTVDAYTKEEVDNLLIEKQDKFEVNTPLFLEARDPNGIQLLNMDNNGENKCWSSLPLMDTNSPKNSYGLPSSNTFNFYYWSTEAATYNEFPHSCIKIPYQLGQVAQIPMVVDGEEPTEGSYYASLGYENEAGLYIPVAKYDNRNLYVIAPNENPTYTPCPTSGYNLQGTFNFGYGKSVGGYSGGGQAWNGCLADAPSNCAFIHISTDKSVFQVYQPANKGECEIDSLSGDELGYLDLITQIRVYPYSVKGSSSRYWSFRGTTEECGFDITKCAVYDAISDSLGNYKQMSQLGEPIHKVVLKNSLSLQYDNTTIGTNSNNELCVIADYPSMDDLNLKQDVFSVNTPLAYDEVISVPHLGEYSEIVNNVLQSKADGRSLSYIELDDLNISTTGYWKIELEYEIASYNIEDDFLYVNTSTQYVYPFVELFRSGSLYGAANGDTPNKLLIQDCPETNTRAKLTIEHLSNAENTRVIMQSNGTVNELTADNGMGWPDNSTLTHLNLINNSYNVKFYLDTLKIYNNDNLAVLDWTKSESLSLKYDESTLGVNENNELYVSADFALKSEIPDSSEFVTNDALEEALNLKQGTFNVSDPLVLTDGFSTDMSKITINSENQTFQIASDGNAYSFVNYNMNVSSTQKHQMYLPTTATGNGIIDWSRLVCYYSTNLRNNNIYKTTKHVSQGNGSCIIIGKREGDNFKPYIFMANYNPSGAVSAFTGVGECPSSIVFTQSAMSSYVLGTAFETTEGSGTWDSNPISTTAAGQIQLTRAESGYVTATITMGDNTANYTSTEYLYDDFDANCVLFGCEENTDIALNAMGVFDSTGSNQLWSPATAISLPDGLSLQIDNSLKINESGSLGVDTSSLASKADLDSKQDKLTFDTAPTEDSSNPITSGAVYTALANVPVFEVTSSGGGTGGGTSDNLSFKVLTQSEYDALETYDSSTLYIITSEQTADGN